MRKPSKLEGKLPETGKTAVEVVAKEIGHVQTVSKAVDSGTLGTVAAAVDIVKSVSNDLEAIKAVEAISVYLPQLTSNLDNLEAVVANLGSVLNCSNNMATLLLVHARMGELLQLTPRLPDIQRLAELDTELVSVYEAIPQIVTLVAHIESVFKVEGALPLLEVVFANLDELVALGQYSQEIVAVAENLEAILAVNGLVAEVRVLHDAVQASAAMVEVARAATESAAASAIAAKDSANTSEANAAASAAAALSSKNSAATSAAIATTKANEASNSASSALASKNAAGVSETSALASKTAAAGSASAAETSKVAAEGFAEESRLSALDAYADMLSAAASATEALASETASETAEANAIAAMTTAGDYKELARISANTAQAAEAVAVEAKDIAANQAGLATASATAANNSAVSADASKLAAAGSASAAKTSETSAKASETAAAGSATTASTKASQAATSASSANTSAANAATSATQAIAAKDAAEIAAASMVGGIVDKGTWDASTGVFPTKPTRPLPEGGSALISAFWKVVVAGVVSGIDFKVGDDLRFSAGTDEFYKVDNTDAVSSVQGKTGVITLTAAEVGALATPTGSHSTDQVLVAGTTAGTSKYSGYTIAASVPANAQFTDTVYVHPTADGSKHVPANGTGNANKFLKASGTAGTYTWATPTMAEVAGLEASLAAKLNTTANAASASKLVTPVTINGVPFDGSASITLNAASPNTLTRGTGLIGSNYNGSAATTWSVAYGTAAGTAAQGNDSRLSDARVPLAHVHSIADTTGLQAELDSKYSPANKPTSVDVGALAVRKALGAGSDLNTMKTDGLFNGYNWANGPTSAIAVVDVKVYSVDWVVQKFYDISTGAQWQRRWYGGNTWGAWERIYTTGFKPTAADVGAQPAGSYATVGHTHTPAEANALQAVPTQISFGGASTIIDTTQFKDYLNSQGAFSKGYWCSRGTWSYANNYIVDTGIGKIHLAGAVVEVWGLYGTCTIKVHLPTTSSGGELLYRTCTYIDNGSTYQPRWFYDFNTATGVPWGNLKDIPVYATRWPNTTEVGAAPASHTHAWGNITGAPVYTTRWPTLAEIGAQAAGSYAAASHTHAWGNITGAPVYTSRWPTAAEAGAVERLESSGHLQVPEGKWWKAASSGVGFLPTGNGQSYLGVSGWSFLESWVNTYRGVTVNVSDNITAYSDKRVKANIENIPNALEKVMQLNGVTYTRTDHEDKEKRHTGVIAQEVEAVLPEAVITSDNGEIEDFKSVAYGNLVGLLIEAIKDQQKQIEELKEVVNGLTK